MSLIDRLSGIAKAPSDAREALVAQLAAQVREGGLDACTILVNEMEDDIATGLHTELGSQSANASSVLAKVGEAAIPSLIPALAKSSWAHIALGGMGGDQAVDLLLGELRSSNWRRVQAAGYGLGMARDKRVLPALRAVLSSTGVGEVSIVCRRAISRIEQADEPTLGDVRQLSLEQLVAALKSETKRDEAAAELGRIGVRALEPLLTLRSNDDDVKRAVVDAIEAIRDPAAVKPLLALLGMSQMEKQYLRAAAEKALAAIGAPAVEPLVTVLEDESDKVRAEARKVLADIGARLGAPAMEPLVAALEHENKAVRNEAASVLGRIGERVGGLTAPRMVDLLTIALTEDDNGLRIASAWALGTTAQKESNGQISCAQAVGPLVEALGHDNSSRMRATAAKALGRIAIAEAPESTATAEVAGPLARALEDTDDDVRQAAFTALKEVPRFPRATGLLVAALKDGRDEVRLCAAEALVRHGTTDAVGPLLEALEHDNSSRIRATAAKALGRIAMAEAPESTATAEAVGPLIGRLDHQDEQVRGMAAQALGAIGDKRAVKPLSAKLKADPYDSVRKEAAQALGAIGDKGAARSLVLALQNDLRDDVRAAAAEALGTIGDMNSVTALEVALQKDTQDKVRSRAREALTRIRGANNNVGPKPESEPAEPATVETPGGKKPWWKFWR